METWRSSDVLIVPDWPAPAGVHALVTTRQMPGNSQPPFDAFNLGLCSGEEEGIVRANRDLLIRALSLPSVPCWLRQVHGTNVVSFDRSLRPHSRALQSESSGLARSRLMQAGHRPPQGEGEKAGAVPAGAVLGEFDKSIEPEADAAITREAGVVLAILTADCLPILLCADDGGEIATLHAGWRGLSGGVIEACVIRMQTPPARLLAWLGPAIGPRSYEVGEEVRAAFVSSDDDAAAAFVPTRPGHWLCDLHALARQRLDLLGVTRVYGTDIDTLADTRFYSYRRDAANSGRFVSLLWM